MRNWLIVFLFNSVAMATTTVDGFYVVPTDRAELKKAAHFPVAITVDNAEDPTRIKFTLPRELTGVENEIEIEKEKNEWAGDRIDQFVRFRKVLTAVKFLIVMKDLSVSTKEAIAFAEKLKKTKEEVTALTALRRYFGNEPAGVLYWNTDAK